MNLTATLHDSAFNSEEPWKRSGCADLSKQTRKHPATDGGHRAGFAHFEASLQGFFAGALKSEANARDLSLRHSNIPRVV